MAEGVDPGRRAEDDPQDLTPEQNEIIRRANETGDWHLRTLVGMVNGMLSGGSIPVTLIVGGVVISGQMIGGAEYFRLFGNDFAEGLLAGSAVDAETTEGIAATYSRTGESIYADADDEFRPPPSFIHLKNARIVHAQGMIPTNRGILWRGRIEMVGGWSLGALEGD